MCSRTRFILGFVFAPRFYQHSLITNLITLARSSKENGNYKKVKYAYQDLQHPVDTASPHSQKVERRREHGYTMIDFTNN
jgi:hypothetical protein